MARLVLIHNSGDIDEVTADDIPEYYSDGTSMFEVFRWSDNKDVGIYIEMEVRIL